MKRHLSILLLFTLTLSLFYSNEVKADENQQSSEVRADTVLSTRTGSASFYAARFHGRHTSNGERLDNEAYTCASYLPYNTWVRVTNLRNGKSVVVRVTDRFRPGGKHLVDLTLRAAKDVDMVRYGVARIRMEVLNPDVVRTLLPKDSISVSLSNPVTKMELPVIKPDCLVKSLIR